MNLTTMGVEVMALLLFMVCKIIKYYTMFGNKIPCNAVRFKFRLHFLEEMWNSSKGKSSFLNYTCWIFTPFLI